MSTELKPKTKKRLNKFAKWHNCPPPPPPPPKKKHAKSKFFLIYSVLLLNEKNKNKSLHNGQQSQTHTVYAATIQTCMLRLIGSVPQQHSLDDDHNFLLYQHFPPFIYQCKWTLSYHQLQMDTVFFINNNKN